MGAGPLVHGNAQGGGENGEKAEGVRFRPSPRAETSTEGCPRRWVVAGNGERQR
jgi:hypothetical protein